jgi:hypothetical protein
MSDLFWIVVPSDVDPSKDNTKTMELTGVCASFTDVSTKLGTPTNIGGWFSDV